MMIRAFTCGCAVLPREYPHTRSAAPGEVNRQPRSARCWRLKPARASAGRLLINGKFSGSTEFAACCATGRRRRHRSRWRAVLLLACDVRRFQVGLRSLLRQALGPAVHQNPPGWDHIRWRCERRLHRSGVLFTTAPNCWMPPQRRPNRWREAQDSGAEAAVLLFRTNPKRCSCDTAALMRAPHLSVVALGGAPVYPKHCAFVVICAGR